MKFAAVVCLAVVCTFLCTVEAFPKVKYACKSAVGKIGWDTHQVHVCENDKGTGVCVSSKLKKCCPGENIWNCTSPLSSTTVYVWVGQIWRFESVTVTFYPIMDGQSESLCYLLDEEHQTVTESCDNHDCDDDKCQMADTLVERCTTNVLENGLECNAETNKALQCQNGYKPPACCDCEDGYVRMYGECIRFCAGNCKEKNWIGTGCKECRPGYAPPDCCECADNYYLSEMGSCRAICTAFALECNENGCTKCLGGYTGPGCCEVDLNICVKNCDKFLPDGTCAKCHNDAYLLPYCCKEIPTVPPNNVCRDNCDGFRLDGTCDKCKDIYFSLDSNCCDCIEGFELTEKGECHPSEKLCRVNCELPDRLRGECLRCRQGYVNPLCCDCEQGYKKTEFDTCEKRTASMENLVEAIEHAVRDIFTSEHM